MVAVTSPPPGREPAFTDVRRYDKANEIANQQRIAAAHGRRGEMSYFRPLTRSGVSETIRGTPTRTLKGPPGGAT